MISKLILKMAVVSAIGTILLMAAPAAVPEAKLSNTTTSIAQLRPFRDLAEIPVGSDPSSIRFEGIKVVKVATKRTSTTDQSYCGEGYREPGGSMYCRSTEDGASVPAYQITYSFSGPPLGSDEYGNTYFTFTVNMRPEDFSPSVREAVSAREMSQAAARKLVKFSTHRGSVEQVAIDDANSFFCDGNYVDGLWTHTDPKCEEKVTYKTVTVPSDYITVEVEPAAPTTSASSALVGHSTASRP